MRVNRVNLSNLVQDFWKLILATAGTATGAGVIAVLGSFGIDISPGLAIAIAGALAALAVGAGPANATLPVRKPPEEKPTDPLYPDYPPI